MDNNTPIEWTPAIGDVFHVICTKTEKVNTGAFGLTSVLVRARDYEHLIFRAEAADDVVIVATPLKTHLDKPAPVALRRDDFTFSRVGSEVLAALGLGPVTVAANQ